VEQYYGNVERERDTFKKKMAELQSENNTLRSKEHSDCYTFTNGLLEEEEEATESIENVARLEKQNAILKEKNSILLKTNQEYKKRLEALTKGDNHFSSLICFLKIGSQKYTVDEHVAIFKEDTSNPTMVNFGGSDNSEYEQS
jgi:DNA repair exonuclease SbcCD ATPase subunit